MQGAGTSQAQHGGPHGISKLAVGPPRVEQPVMQNLMPPQMTYAGAIQNTNINRVGNQNNRKREVLVYGKAQSGNETNLSADFDLVAQGVVKDASEDDLRNFLINKGLDVVEVELLTRHPNSRTHSFRVKIKAWHYDMSMDANIWPNRVTVRMYRHPRRETTQDSWTSQSRHSGSQAPMAQNPKPQRTLPHSQNQHRASLIQQTQNYQVTPNPSLQMIQASYQNPEQMRFYPPYLTKFNTPSLPSQAQPSQSQSQGYQQQQQQVQGYQQQHQQLHHGQQHQKQQQGHLEEQGIEHNNRWDVPGYDNECCN